MKYSAIFISLLVSLLVAAQSSAQPHYPKDFAGSTYNRELPANPTNRKESLTTNQEQELETQTNTPKDTNDTIQLIPPTDPSQLSVQLPDNGVEVKSIGGYIDARNQAQFARSIEELKITAERFDFAIGKVVGIGNFGWLFNRPELVLPLILRDGQPTVLNSVPKDLNITSSPAWLIETPQGTIILEGTGPLDELFTDDGKLALSRIKLSAPQDKNSAHSENSKVTAQPTAEQSLPPIK